MRKQLCLHVTANFYSARYGTEQLLASARKVECVFYQNDSLAFGGLQYCANKDLDLTGDIGTAGWGDLAIASVLKRRMTPIYVSHLKIGQTAAEMLISRLSGELVKTWKDIGFHLISGSTAENTNFKVDQR